MIEQTVPGVAAIESRSCAAETLPSGIAPIAPGASDVYALQARIEFVGEAADLKAVYGTERPLLSVACTRARDVLWVSGVEPASEELEDLKGEKSSRTE